MDKLFSSYIFLILSHVLLAFVFYLVPFSSTVYGLLIIPVGIYFVVKNRNRDNEVLYFAAYLVAIEVFLRMTNGNLLNEYVKYSVIFFMILGMVYSGFSKNAIPYWLFLFLLIPGIIISSVTLSVNTDIRKAIAFNISGPVCLGISAIYCYQRKITYTQLNTIITALSLPILSTAIYLFLYSPSIKDVVKNTSSNYATSGGFGPNQVSTVLGLGIFLFFTQLTLNSKSKKAMIVNTIILILISFRGLVTFSRGGIYAGIVMILMLSIVLFFLSNSKGKFKLTLVVLIAIVTGFGVWAYSSIQTVGLIDKRYANQDAAGREKTSQLSGREKLMSTEIQMFLDNPVFGIGVGKNKEYREELTGITAASHNEVTRMLAEHGSLGIMALIILILTPLILYLNNLQHIYLLSFFAFWALTINHAAMRTASPAFIYALSLLKVYIVEKEPTVHRE